MNKMIAALPLAAGLAFAQQGAAQAATSEVSFAGGGVTVSAVITYTPTAGGADPITGITGTFSDSGLGLTNVAITGLVPINNLAQPPNGPAGTPIGTAPGNYPTALSYFLVANGVLAPGQPLSPFMSFDNLFYPGGSPIVCANYFGEGGFLDVFGLAFSIDASIPADPGAGNLAVDMFSNGSPNFLPPGLPIYGAVVSDTLNNVQYVAGGISGAVPEPSTWAMMLMGFFGLGFAGWRKAKNRAATVA